MDSRIIYTSCPVCNAAAISKIFTVKDYNVSQESFEIYQCSSCQLRFTQSVPDATAIGDYYKSENYISHSDTTKGWVNRLYHRVRSVANIQKRKLIEKITGLHQGNLLDVGSGTGYFIAEMKKAGWSVTGLEPDARARKIARENNRLELLPSENLFQLPAKYFDVITLWHVLEHVHDLKRYVAQLSCLLNQEGKILVAVPNYFSYDAEKYKNFWAAYDVPRHLYHFSPVSMHILMQQAGLEITDIKPLWYDSFYISLLSTRYKKGKPHWPDAILTGLLSNWEALRNVKRCSSLIYIISKK